MLENGVKLFEGCVDTALNIKVIILSLGSYFVGFWPIIFEVMVIHCIVNLFYQDHRKLLNNKLTHTFSTWSMPISDYDQVRLDLSPVSQKIFDMDTSVLVSFCSSLRNTRYWSPCVSEALKIDNLRIEFLNIFSIISARTSSRFTCRFLLNQF